MTFEQVDLFHSGVAPGDAITNDMLAARDVFRANGYSSNVYAEYIDERMSPEVLSIQNYSKTATRSLMLVHHSHGMQAMRLIRDIPSQKILVYHNITPPAFLVDNEYEWKMAQLGRVQLREYRSLVIGAVADSWYNADELRQLQIPVLGVIPPLLRLHNHLAMWVGMGTHNRTRHWLSRDTDLNLLFIGRIAPSKCQRELVDLVWWLRRYGVNARLDIVGRSHGDDPYFRSLQQRIKHLGLGSHIQFTGWVEDEALLDYYRRADLYVSLSEHEGFGVPIVEAMAAGVPVLAYDAGAVRETMGRSGILVREKSLPILAQFISALRTDTDIELIIQQQRDHVTGLLRNLPDTWLGLVRSTEDLRETPSLRRCLEVQLQGPLETSYSLAFVNRQLALHLRELPSLSVSVYPTEGPGNYEPDWELIRQHHGLSELIEEGSAAIRPDVVIRNLYPPRVGDMPGHLNILWFAWEETRIDPKWAWAFNASLDGIIVPSEFVRDALQQSGVEVPIKVVPYGVLPPSTGTRTPRLERYLSDAKPFRFLHISSGFPRKGLDVLLRAYSEAFSADDPVSLIVKVFPNEHNQIDQLISSVLDSVKSPHVILINDILTQSEIDYLHEQANCEVYPTRGEGFGLPIADAVQRGTPVIVTDQGGHMAFCRNRANVYLIRSRWAQSESHLAIPHSQWAEPDAAILRDTMRRVYDFLPHKSDARNSPTVLPSWHFAATSVEHFVRTLWDAKFQIRRVGLITTWNTRCGIAEYSRYLLQHLDPTRMHAVIFANTGEPLVCSDTANVVRCWTKGGALSRLATEITRHHIDIVNIQFNFGFYDMAELRALIGNLRADGRVVCVTLHSARERIVNGMLASLEQIADTLAEAHFLLVHTEGDRNFLRSIGLCANVVLLPHGLLTADQTPWDVHESHRENGPLTVGTFGFLLPDKGLKELLVAFAFVAKSIPDVRLRALTAAHQDGLSQAYLEECRSVIDKYSIDDRVHIVTDFLEPEVILKELSGMDVVVYPYQRSTESSSAAARFALATGRATITTDLPVFADIKEATLQVALDAGVEALARVLLTVLRNESLRQQLAQKAAVHADRFNWNNVGSFYQTIMSRINDASAV